MKARLLTVIIALGVFASMVRAGGEESVNELILRLAATNVEERYAAQMELQALAAKASRPEANAERAELAKVLSAKAADATVPQPARVWIVRQLEYIGADESVAALTGLMGGSDAELRECARRALEKNPASAATESLRAALEKGGEASWRIGLMQSLGERRDAASAFLIGQNLNSADTTVAAAEALGKIASEPAIKALWMAWENPQRGRYLNKQPTDEEVSKVFDLKMAVVPKALVAAANELEAKGEARQAAAIYGKLYAKSASAPVRAAAALTGLAKADPAAAKKLLAEAFSSNDPRLETAALSAAREVCGKGASAALADMLPKLDASAKIVVLPALDAAAEKQVIAMASDANEAVGLAALETLGRIGDADSVPFLLDTASEKNSDRQKAAAGALARLSDSGAGEAIAKSAAQGEARHRVAAINALGARDDTAAVPALWGCAAESDRAVSKAACGALGKLCTDGDIDKLARLALAGTTPGAEGALESVVSRAKDKPAAAHKLMALVAGATPEQLAVLFDSLAIVGGSEGLNAIESSTSNSNDQIKDAAIRALANWPDYEATAPLLAIAADANARPVHKVLAIQGVVRLVKAADKETAEARLDAALAAMKAARRDQEKQLVLSALAAVPSARSAEAIKSFLSDPNLKLEAGLAGVTLAGELRKTNKAVSMNLAQAVKDANVSESTTRKAEALLKE